MSFLAPFKDKKVTVITTDGRFFSGVLNTFDLSTNLVLTDTSEIILGDINAIQDSEEEEDETQVIPLGVYFIRGDCVVCCGLNDEELESQINWLEVCFVYSFHNVWCDAI